MSCSNEIVLLTDEDEKYIKSIPNSGALALKPHQLTSLKKCIDMENGTVDVKSDRYEMVRANVGILSDMVGGGKSYIILSLLLVNDVPTIDYTFSNVYGFNNVCIEYRKRQFVELNLNVIVCPFGIIHQWEDYINKFHDFKYIKVNKRDLFSQFEKCYANKDLLLISSTFYKFLCDFCIEKNIRVKRLIFDEADNASTPNAKKIEAKFYWFVTSSFKNLLNPYPVYSYTCAYNHHTMTNRYLPPQLISAGVYKNTFVKNLFIKLIKDLPALDQCVMNSLIVKNNDDYIRKSYSIPDIRQYFIECKDNLLGILYGVTNNAMFLAAINAGDMKSAINILKKDNKGDEDHIINLVKKDLEVNLQNGISKLRYYESLIVDNEEQHKDKIETLKENVAQIENKIRLLHDRVKTNNTCIICYNSPPVKRIVTMCCKSTYCFECIGKYVAKYNNKCPMCRNSFQRLDEELMLIDDNKGEDIDFADRRQNKIQTLMSLISHFEKEEDNNKILIFSGYDGTFDNVSKTLCQHNIAHNILQGKGLKKAYDRYKDPKSNMDILLMNSYLFGSGLNLENTTDIIMFHSFDDQIVNQIIGRGQRPGRTTPLRVWYLLNENEVTRMDESKKNKMECFSF